jgi:hypothetical protein
VYILKSPKPKKLLKFSFKLTMRNDSYFNIELVSGYALHRLDDQVLESELAAVLPRLLLDKLGKQGRLLLANADRLLRGAVVVNEAYVSLNHRLLGKL